ncbi:MAG: TlpA disulfide reductase family protein [Syntrophobacteraceae bacterium]|jgi:peroxiredoxin
MNRFKSGNRFTALLFSLILLITILIGLPAVAAETNQTAPDFKLQDLKGTSVTLSQFKGEKPVLLYFWATWCEVCKSVRPSIIEMQKTTGQDAIEILAIDVGVRDSLAKVKRFEEANPAPYIVLYDLDSKVTHSYGVQGIPHFVLLDKTGAIKYEGSLLPSDPMDLLR